MRTVGCRAYDIDGKLTFWEWVLSIVMFILWTSLWLWVGDII